MRTSANLAILAFVFSLTSCGPPGEEIAEVAVTNTAEVKSAVSVELQQAQSSEDVPTHAATDVPTQPATDVPTQLATDAPTQPATDVPNQPATDVPTQPATDAPTAATPTPLNVVNYVNCNDLDNLDGTLNTFADGSLNDSGEPSHKYVCVDDDGTISFVFQDQIDSGVPAGSLGLIPEDRSDVAEHYINIGYSKPHREFAQQIVVSSDIPQDVVDEWYEIQDSLNDTIGSYNRYVMFIYTDNEHSQNVFDKLEEVHWHRPLRIEDGYLVDAGCLTGSGIWNVKPPDPYSLCIMDYEFIQYPHETRDWGSSKSFRQAIIYHGWAHEYFHRYQQAFVFDGNLGSDELDTPAWWIEGAAIVFPNIWLGNNWQDFSAFRGLSFSDVDVEGMDLERWYRDTKRAAQGVSHQGNHCNDHVFGPAEEHYETMRCFLGMANAYLAYLTSYQTVWVSIPTDLYDLGFEKSFQKHTGMTLQEFYDKFNAFLRKGNPDDPPPPGFFPKGPISDFANFPSLPRTVPVAQEQSDAESILDESVTPSTHPTLCSRESSHIHCVSQTRSRLDSGFASDLWGTQTDYSADVYCALDLTITECERYSKALFMAADHSGNYSPVSLYAVGTDRDAALGLVDVLCNQPARRKHMGYEFCTKMNSDAGNPDAIEFLRSVGSVSIEKGEANWEGYCNCNRGWETFEIFMSVNWGYLDEPMFGESLADAHEHIFHEYFHVVQNSHLSSPEKWELRKAALGPRWFHEGGATYMSLLIPRELMNSQQLDSSPIQSHAQSPFAASMSSRLKNTKRIFGACEGGLRDTGNNQVCGSGDLNAAYSGGAWAHAYLTHKHGEDVLLETFYPNLESMGFEDAFIYTYGQTLTDFHAEFDEFLKLPLEEQLSILP